MTDGIRKRRPRDPAADPVWREYAGSIARFAQTDLAEPGIDAGAWSIISLAGDFLWPVWAHSHSQDEAKRYTLSKRFAREMLRLSIYGSINSAKFPEIAAELVGEVPIRPTLRAADRSIKTPIHKGTTPCSTPS